MALFTAIGAAIFGAGTFLAATTAFVLQTVVGVGLSLLAQSIAGKKTTPQQERPQGPGYSINGSLRAAGDVPRSFILGEYATAGSLVYANTWGSLGDTPNAFLTQVIALSDLPCKDLNGVWVNGELCTLGTATDSKGQPVTEYQKGGENYLWIKFYDGTQTTADALLTGSVTSADRPYQGTRVGTGIAYVVCTARIEETLFTGFPEFKFVVDGVPLYDITADTTAGGSGSQVWTDPETWGGDGDYLPAVQIYNLLRGIEYDDEWFYGLQGMAGARLPATNWIAQVAKCRTTVPAVGGGNEATYRSGLEVQVGNDIAGTIEQLLTACQGKVSEIGGFYKIHLGAPDSPTFTFTDADILSTDEQTFTPFFGLSETINGVAAKHPSPTDGWNIVPAPPLYRTDLEALAGNRRLMADVELNAVPYAAQVQRLMRSALLEGQRARRHTHAMPPEFWIYEPGDTGTWNSTRNGYVDKVMRLDGVVDRANLDVLWDLTEIDPDDYDFDIDTDYTTPTNGAVGFPRPPAQAIVDWFAEAATIFDGAGNPRRPAIAISWDGDQDDIVGIEYELRLEATEVVVHRGRTENYAAGSLVVSQAVLPSTTYEIRGRYIPAGSRDTLFSDWLEVTSPAVGLTPPDFEPSVQAALQRIDELSGDLFSIRGQLNDLSGAVVNHTTAMQESLARNRLVVGSRTAENKAAVEVVSQTVTTLDAALADFLVGVIAETGAGTAESLLRMSALSDTELDGALARILFQVRAGQGGDLAEAAMELRAISDPDLGLLTQFILSAQQAYLRVSDELVIPMHALRRMDEVKTVPIVSGTPNTVQVDLGTRHQTYSTLLTDDVEVQFPLNAFIGEWNHIFTQDSTGGHAITVDEATYLLNSDGFEQPSTVGGVISVYKCGVARIIPDPVAYMRLSQYGITAGLSEVIAISPAVDGKSIWNFTLDGALTLGPGTYTIIPLGDDASLSITLVGAGGSSGSATLFGSISHPASSGATTMTGTGLSLSASAGGRSLSAKQTITGGGAAGVATGGDININGNSGTSASTSPSGLVFSGKGGDSADAFGGGAQARQFGPAGEGIPAAPGIAGGFPGAGAGGAVRGGGPAHVFAGAGGAGAGAKLIAAKTLTQDVVYTITVGAAGSPGTTSDAGSGSGGNGARGGNGQAVLTAG